jgi:hypothetical protein
MKKRIIYLITILLLTLTGCDNNDPETTSNVNFDTIKTEYGGCFYNGVGAAKSDEWPVDSLYCLIDTSGLKVVINKIDNCCAELKDTYINEGDTLKIFIHDEGLEPCRCNCQFDFTYSVAVVTFQTVFIKVYYQGYGESTYLLWKETSFCNGLID